MSSIVQDHCWTVPIVAACTVFFIMPISSSYGLLYVLFMEHFGISHEQAAWPQSVYIFAAHTAGLLVTVLQQNMTVYHMTLAGALLACIGLVASAFAPDIVWMSVLVGGVYGAGAGIVLMSLSLYTLTYFDEYRATATAVKYAGWSASGVVGPTLLAYLSETYGSLPSLLLVGAIAAHGIPLVLLLQNPRPVTIRFPCRKIASVPRNGRNKISSVRSSPLDVLPSDCPLLKGNLGVMYGAEKKTATQPGRGEVSVESRTANDINSQINLTARDHLKHPPRASKTSSGSMNSRACGSGSCRSKYLVVKAPDIWKHCAALLRSFHLYALVACFVAVDYSSSMHEGTIVAYGMDKKSGTLNQCNQLQTFLAAGQLAGRLIVPFLSDKIPFSRCPITAGSLALSAATLVLMSITSDYAVLVALTTTLGACQGFLLCIKGVLYADYLGVESLGLTCGLQGLSLVPFIFSSPAIIGFFRDKKGSYDQFYWMLGAMNIVAASIICCVMVTDRLRRKQWAVRN